MIHIDDPNTPKFVRFILKKNNFQYWRRNGNGVLSIGKMEGGSVGWRDVPASCVRNAQQWVRDENTYAVQWASTSKSKTDPARRDFVLKGLPK